MEKLLLATSTNAGEEEKVLNLFFCIALECSQKLHDIFLINKKVTFSVFRAYLWVICMNYPEILEC